MSNKYEEIIKRWQQIPTSCGERDLENNLINFIFDKLGVDFAKRDTEIKIGEGLRADYLIYADEKKTQPLIVVEAKRREADLAEASDEDFFANSKTHKLYRESVGYDDISGNGIKQYLDIKKVDQGKLAKYGLVLNGDFFQLWKRVDGLVMPLTDIQRMKAENIPELMKQIELCLKNKRRALVVAVWNQKGGVAKTTNTVNIGATLALAGKKVLLIDLDEQNDLTRGLGLQPEKQHDSWLRECLNKMSQRRTLDTREILKKAIKRRVFPTSDKKKLELSVLPISEKELEGLRQLEDGYKVRNPVQTFAKIIKLLTPSFDYIFIDSSPAPDRLTRCLMYSIDTLLIPVDYGKKSIHHGVNIYKQLEKIRVARKKVESTNLGAWNLGLVYSNCPSDAGKVLDQMIDKELQKNDFSGKRYDAVIRTYAQTKIAEFKHMPVVCWRKSHVTKCYRQLVNKIFLSPNFIDE